MKNTFKYLIIPFMLLFCISVVNSWTPQSDIDLRNVYNIINGSEINTTTLYVNGAQITGAGGGNTSWNETYADTLYLSIGYTHLSNFTDNLGTRGYTSLSNFTNDLDLINETFGNSTYILQSDEGNLNVNSSTWWSGVSSWSTSMFESVANVLNINMTWLNASISSVISSEESGFNVNSSDYWDNLNTTSDINAGDITDDGTYVTTGSDQEVTIAGENITSGTIDDARIPSGITRDSELANVSPIGLSGTTYSLIECGDDEAYFYNTTSANWECRGVSGSGTVTSVGSGEGLQGGPITASGTLAINRTYFDTEYYNQSEADTTFIAQSSEGDLNVNSSDFWDVLDTFNVTQFFSLDNLLHFNETWMEGVFDSVYCQIAGCTMAGDIDMNGNSIVGALDVNSTGKGNFASVNTGQGDYELYAMDQDVETSDAVTFASVDTGQGANELYNMNQNVQTTDAVTFDNVTISTDVTTENIIFEGNTTHINITSNATSLILQAGNNKYILNIG